MSILGQTNIHNDDKKTTNQMRKNEIKTDA